MIVDTSALVAVLDGEPEGERYLDAMLAHEVRLSAVTAFEFGIVMDRRGDARSSRGVQILLDQIDARVVPVTAESAAMARAAYARFGKGVHPARLNFGDCFAYALAREFGEPLLFKGDDFAQTDVEVVP